MQALSACAARLSPIVLLFVGLHRRSLMRLCAATLRTLKWRWGKERRSTSNCNASSLCLLLVVLLCWSGIDELPDFLDPPPSLPRAAAAGRGGRQECCGRVQAAGEHTRGTRAMLWRGSCGSCCRSLCCCCCQLLPPQQPEDRNIPLATTQGYSLDGIIQSSTGGSTDRWVVGGKQASLGANKTMLVGPQKLCVCQPPLPASTLREVI